MKSFSGFIQLEYLHSYMYSYYSYAIIIEAHFPGYQITSYCIYVAIYSYIYMIHLLVHSYSYMFILYCVSSSMEERLCQILEVKL